MDKLTPPTIKMPVEEQEPISSGFCVYSQTVCDGNVPIQHDDEGRPIIYSTEFEAQQDIAQDMRDRLQDFIESAGGMSFDEAIECDETVMAVDVYADGSIVDEFGERYLFCPGCEPQGPVDADED